MQKKFSYPLKIDELDQNEHKFDLNADNEELVDIREILQVEDVKYFNAEICMKRNNKQNMLNLWGIVRTEIELKSVITLNNFLKYYEIPFELRFDTKASYKDYAEFSSDINDDVPDIIENGTINLADIALEQIALQLDDYPRAEGEVFDDARYSDFHDEPKESPFAVLAKLKK
ncbi:MAG: DUF177 domain-containing protein [Alphaproteobacteria bacterium]|nr:DUF177 domain-containing protein [Alphaproteobacteria bacterium]